MITWCALVRSSEGESLVWVSGRNRFEAMRAALELVPGCQVLSLTRSKASLELGEV